MKKAITTILGVITAICFIATIILLLGNFVPAATTIPLTLVGIICVFVGLHISERDESLLQVQPSEA